MKQLFDQFDSNKDGAITFEELDLSLKDEIENRLQEFLQEHTNEIEAKANDKVGSKFDLANLPNLERFGALRISFKDFKAFNMSGHESFLRKKFKELDANGDGVLTYDDYEIHLEEE